MGCNAECVVDKTKHKCCLECEPGCSFLFCVGKGKRLVKRKEFEKFIEKTLEV